MRFVREHGGSVAQGKTVPLLTGSTYWWFYRPEAGAGPGVSLLFCQRVYKCYLKEALMTGFYKLIYVYLSHPSPQFLAPSVRMQLPYHVHINTTGVFLLLFIKNLLMLVLLLSLYKDC